MKYKQIVFIVFWVALGLFLGIGCDSSSSSRYSSGGSYTNHQPVSSSPNRYPDSSSQSSTNIQGNIRSDLNILVMIAGNWVKCMGFVLEYDSGTQEWVYAPGYLTCSLFKDGREVELQPVSVHGKFDYNFITNRQSGEGWYYKATLWTKDSKVLVSKEGEVR